MAIDFKTALTIGGLVVVPGYPAIAGLTPGHVLRATENAAIGFGAIQASDLPTTLAYKNSDNQFSAAQGFGGAAATLANRLYAAPVNGSTLPLIKAGNQSSAMAGQIAISGISLNTNAVQGDSYAEAGVAGIGRGDYGVGLHGEVSYNYTTNVRTVARLRHTSSQTTVAGFGAGLNFEATRGAPPTYDVMATIAAFWTTPGSTLAALTFSVAGGFTPVERMRLTSTGYLGLNTASPAGDLHLNIRDQEQAFCGLTIGGVTGTYAPGLIFRRSDGSYTTPSSTSNNVELGRISFYIYTASGWGEGAYIRAINVTGGEARADLAFVQDTGSTIVETMRLVAGKVGVRTSAPTFTLEAAMLDVYPAINIKELSTSTRRATIGFGLDAGVTTGWIMGQSYGNDTTRDFYLLDAMTSTIRLRIGTDGKVAIAPSGSTAPFALLSIGATSASTNSGEAFVARASSTVGTAVNSITYVGEFRASTTNNNRLLFYAYRRTADGNWPGTGWRLQAAVDNSFTAYNDGKSYIELSNNNAIYFGTGGADSGSFDGSGNLFVNNAIFPGNNGGAARTTQASYYLYGDTGNGGIRTNGAFLANGNIYWGSGSNWLSAYLNQAVTTTATVTFGSTTAGVFDATGGLGSNHFQALCASGLYMQMFSGEAGVSFTNGVIGYNYGNLSGSSAGRLTAGWGGGLIRFVGDGSGALISMDTAGTFRFIFEWGTTNVGVGVAHGSNNRLYVKGVDSTSSNNAFLCQNSNGSNLMYVRNDGLVWANQAWTISDIRTKENIRALPYGLAHLMGLRPVIFDFIAGAKEQLGFIAQEVRAVVPEIVMEEQANADYTIDPMLALNPSGIIPILVRSVQEQQKLIEAQAAQIADLVARIQGAAS
jgi:hypothetical protein